MRLGRFLSHAGLCSRRGTAEFIQSNHILYLNKPVSLNTEIPENATLFVNGKEISLDNIVHVLLLNKPVGYVCSHAEQRKKMSIFRLLPDEYKNYFFAGRLDEDSSGLVVLCNKGELIYNLTHPSQKIEKRYNVKISRPLSPSEEARCIKGINDNNELLRFSQMKRISPVEYDLVLHQGKNREIRRIFRRLGTDVFTLHRYQIGNYKLGDLPDGKWKEISETE